MNYLSLYNKLCVRGQLRKSQYKPFSGLHAHHIIPTHAGGSDEPENLTYLTIKEHRLAHFLLWKMHKSPNDLRARHMLGAMLTSNHRRIIGEFCRDNKIGFHAFPDRSDWQQKGRDHQLDENGIPKENTWMYWSSKIGRKHRASMGGKASLDSGNNQQFLYWASPEGLLQRASMGGKAHVGKKWVTNGHHKTRVTPDKIDEYLSKGYKLGKLGTTF